MSRSAHVVAVLTAAALAAHAVAGFWLTTLPGWRMFAYADRFSVRAVAHGEPVDFRDWVPARAYVNNPYQAWDILQWIARRHPEHTPMLGEISVYPDDGGPPARRSFRLGTPAP